MIDHTFTSDPVFRNSVGSIYRHYDFRSRRHIFECFGSDFWTIFNDLDSAISFLSALESFKSVSMEATVNE